MRKPTTGIIAAWFATIAMTFAATEGWTSDWQAAKDRSKAEGKPILLYMTGSDWCGWCKKLEKEVISQPAFMDFAKRHFVLMEADYPRKKEQTPELKKQNAALEKTYLAGGYPTMWVLDSGGNKLSGDLGEIKGGVDGYIAKLKEYAKAGDVSTRAINGEVRVWVNGEDVSGGTACNPAICYLCLESEGSPIRFRRLRIRELP